MNANGRRCRQFANGYTHISGMRRPHYKKATTSVAESIARSQAAARRQAQIKSKPKSK